RPNPCGRNAEPLRGFGDMSGIAISRCRPSQRRDLRQRGGRRRDGECEAGKEKEGDAAGGAKPPGDIVTAEDRHAVTPARRVWAAGSSAATRPTCRRRTETGWRGS